MPGLASNLASPDAVDVDIERWRVAAGTVLTEAE